ncbi:MAG: P-II family nitrogen regulator [Elusimicrobiota bacterium]|jgi:nitrogen regulatory protein P-II 1|nr:P-II family nitrogen regulator [Elusimicrobiota bacterium]
MIKIEAIVREDKFEDIKEALSKVGVNGITVSQVMGCGRSKGYKELIRGSEVTITMLPKLKFEIIVSDESWEKKTIDAILQAAYTGNPGDGKIFSYDLRNVIRVRTKEQGTAAIN